MGSTIQRAAAAAYEQSRRHFYGISGCGGLGAVAQASRRGAAFGDVNNDGNVDVLLLNVGEPPTLLLNHGVSGNHRVMFRLVGTKSNRAAIGARVTVHAGKLNQFNEVRGGSSYLSQNDPRLHFGLGRGQKSTRSRSNGRTVLRKNFRISLPTKSTRWSKAKEFAARHALPAP